MATTPNHFGIVKETADQFPDLLRTNTLESIQAFMLILGPRMADADSNWGYLTKTPGEKHITLPDGQFVSVDSFIYNPTQQVIDCLTNAADPAFGPASPVWQAKEKRPENNWYPIKDYGPPTPDNGGNGNGDDSAAIADLQKQIDELKAQMANTVKYEDKIGLLSNGAEDHPGKVICAENGGPYKDHEPFVLTSRSAVGPWESFQVKRGQ